MRPRGWLRDIGRRCAVTATLAWLHTACICHAQQPDAEPGPSHLGVYLNDSFEVRQEIRLLERLEDSGHWIQAGIQVRKLIDQHGDQLVSIGENLYSSVAVHLDRRVSSWPPEGLRAYRDLYEEESQARLDKIRRRPDQQALHELFYQRFSTRAGGQAGLLLAQLHLEAGRFETASSVLERLLTEHSDFADAPPQVLALQVAALHWSGRTAQAREAATRAGARHPEATIQWLGASRALTDVLDEILGTTLQRRQDESEAYLWAAFGGNAARNRIIDSTATVGAAVWSFNYDTESNAADTESEPVAAAQDATRGRFFNHFPAVRLGRVFLHDSSRAWALDIDTGRDLWRYELPELAGREEAVGGDTGPPAIYAPAYHDGRLYVAFGTNDVPYYGYPTSLARSALLCLDADTGQPVWKIGGQQLSPQFTTVQLDGAPVCTEDCLLAVARRRKAFGFEDCLLMCFDRRDGDLLWQTHLGGASAGGYGYRKATVSAPAVSGDTVFVQSNLGTVGAADVHTGLLRWLYVYPQTDVRTSMWSEQVAPWQYNPTIVWKDCVISAPLDLDQVLVLEQNTGRVRFQIPDAQLGGLGTILGVQDDRLCFVGDEVGAWDLARNQLIWSHTVPDDGSFGRGLLLADALLIPTRRHLLQYDLAGTLLHEIPWDTLEARGNLIATPTELLVASSHRLSCYARKDDAFARLRLRIQAAPHDPGPSLDLAEMAFRTGDYTVGIEALQQSIQRAGGLLQIADPVLKRRIFDDAVDFADRLLREAPAQQDQILALFGLAAQCPPDTQSAVLYRFKLALFHEQARRFTDAVGVYRQILTDRSLYEHVPPRAWHQSTDLQALTSERSPSGSTARTAGEMAAGRIAALIQRHGREIYAPYDAKARELLERGIALEQAALIQRVVDAFPNADAAPDALMALGNLHAERGEFLAAARKYKMAKNLYADRVDQADVYARVVTSYLKAGRRRTAAAWLLRAQRRFPHRVVNVDGHPLRFRAWYEELFPSASFAEPPLPRLEPPLVHSCARRFGAEVTILQPRFGHRLTDPSDVYLAYYAGKLILVDPLRDLDLWPQPAPCRVEPALLAVIPGQTGPTPDLPDTTEQKRLPLFLLATRHQVFALDSSKGRPVWTFGRYPADLDLPEADHENFANFNNYAFCENRLVCTQTRGRATALDAVSGQTLWDLELANPALDEPAALSEEYFLYHSMSGGMHLYPLLNAETGELLRVFETPESAGPPVHMALLPEGIALIITAQTCWAYDTDTGLLQWSDEHSGRAFEATIQIGLDGFYISQNSRHIVKRSLDHQRILWTSPSLRPDGGPCQALAASLRGDVLYVVSDEAVLALDIADGRILWEGATGGGANFLTHELAADVLLAVDLQQDEGRSYTAYFYRRQGGRIPANGGVLPLGRFDHLRGIALRDHCLLVADGQTVHVWSEQGRGDD
ncbi:MAG: PQQ-binding-like beta-propeller repeat protein [Phycisphaerales bacterium]|nr:MAG: PQQ-binding-like beta-propeller repeat protein [Phycisphaerales bacterium]